MLSGYYRSGTLVNHYDCHRVRRNFQQSDLASKSHNIAPFFLRDADLNSPGIQRDGRFRILLVNRFRDCLCGREIRLFQQ
ncbi:hypothetical protein HRbin36_00852 [bacterium HR36]|nr:hypothetical protein HRbin36_00852 [bacterium HR36]